jgi:hypothetical protein
MHAEPLQLLLLLLVLLLFSQLIVALRLSSTQRSVQSLNCQ